MKTTLSLAPSAALRIFHFDDIDLYRSGAAALQFELTPLVRKISARQFMLTMPGCDMLVERSFPRLTGGTLMPGRTVIGFSMTDEATGLFNGIDLKVSTLVLGHSGAGYVAYESTPHCFARVAFEPEVRDRGWPAAENGFAQFFMSQSAHDRLRCLVMEIMTLASRSAGDLQRPEVAQGAKESLLAAADDAFENSSLALGARSAHADRLLWIIKSIDEIIAANPANPIYSSELAHALGVSVRTLHNAVLRYRGMSLHRYLRLKRLWQVRQRLLVGNISVKACALAYGFWHLSDFSRSYRTLFGELPSQTLALAH
ncbi:AraC family transcriptional regulator [Rhodopseudomonas palustris]|uniref:AraC family transcriptional regulator n=1 Tax=Rhodopseudomonas palustris TaxID=1076 RepID=A0A323UDD5_RHOPL|nr:AraC family transcriptional regulator [Rhodopseudomonas palustris]PZA10872.1 AraC family transcriptional regulator [Rhodopseudomonas palustris]